MATARGAVMGKATAMTMGTVTATVMVMGTVTATAMVTAMATATVMERAAATDLATKPSTHVFVHGVGMMPMHLVGASSQHRPW